MLCMGKPKDFPQIFSSVENIVTIEESEFMPYSIPSNGGEKKNFPPFGAHIMRNKLGPFII